MPLNISDRGRLMPPSPIRKLAPYADAAKKKGVHVYHLNIGQPDIETPPEMRDRLKLLQDKVYAYTPSGGTHEYIQSLCRYYKKLGLDLSAGQILATTGGSEAILFALMACCNPDDEAIVVEPFYTNYRSFAMMAGVKLVPILSKGEDGFHLPDRSSFENARTSRTRMVILCNPNNPTGTVYGHEELSMVAQFCKDHGLYLLADEVYREFVYDDKKVISTLSLPGYEQHVIVVDSMSKRYSASGIRLGCLVTRNEEVFSSCMRMAQGRLSPPGLAQFIAIGADNISQNYTNKVVAEYQNRRDILFQGLRDIPGVFLRKPEGAFYFIARLPVLDSDHFASWLLSEFEYKHETVMVAPADGFYVTPGLGKNEVRIAYVLNEDDLRNSVDILSKALQTYSRK
ncbi:MAG TPA: pyridoxal phosphate-dependent aminotransferase [Gemmatales bacterium]|nr:pyridoxal phosphate-dependent aminotransferase [Gemmatales bacterium]